MFGWGSSSKKAKKPKRDYEKEMADLAKSKKLLGYEPSVKLEDWIRSYET